MHAWVLVKAGERGVKDDAFVEPSTGRMYPPAHSPYTGIEFAFNHVNYWVCMQHAEPHSDCRVHPAKVRPQTPHPGSPMPADCLATQGRPRRVLASTCFLHMLPESLWTG